MTFVEYLMCGLGTSIIYALAYNGLIPDEDKMGLLAGLLWFIVVVIGWPILIVATSFAIIYMIIKGSGSD